MDAPDPKRRKGGLSQRLAAVRGEYGQHDQATQAVDTKSHLAEHLIEAWAWGKYSPQQIQCIAALAKKDMEALGVATGQSSLNSLANLGSQGKHCNNVHRDLMNIVKDRSSLPEPLMVNMPFKSNIFLQAVMLPHLVFHFLYTHYKEFWHNCFLPSGVEGLVAFWKHFSSHPCMVGFKGCKPQWQRWTLPVNLHGDAVPTVGCGKIWSKMLQAYSWTCLLSKGSTKQRSFFIWGATWLKDSKLLVALQLVLKHVEEILWV